MKTEEKIEVGSIMSYNNVSMFVHFYQVIELRGKSTVILQEIESKTVKETKDLGWRSYVAGVKDAFKENSKPFTRRINAKYPTMVKLEGNGMATAWLHLWDGKPEYQDLLD